ncbi:MAG: DUF502 domain-containing protein [Pseudomonadota bacterium]|nr:DUF502 domain-containing protein [Pseudomonadota bacterium]
MTQKKHTIKTYLFTGILVTAPIAMTFYLAAQLFLYIDSRVTALIPEKYSPEYSLPGVGVILLLLFLILIGMLTANFVGRALMRFGQSIIERMPIISGIYNAFRKIFETLLGAGKNTAFRQPVLVDYPRKGIKTIAFLTGPVYREIQGMSDDALVSIYVPTTPNPTSGFLLYVPKKEVIPLKIGVDEALKIILSMGIINPDDEPARKAAWKRKTESLLKEK